MEIYLLNINNGELVIQFEEWRMTSFRDKSSGSPKRFKQLTFTIRGDRVDDFDVVIDKPVSSVELLRQTDPDNKPEIIYQSTQFAVVSSVSLTTMSKTISDKEWGAFTAGNISGTNYIPPKDLFTVVIMEP